MKNLSFIHKILLIINIIVAVILFLAFLAPKLPTGFLSILSLLSLVFPIIVLINIIFMLFWLVKLKKYLLISLLVLLLNYSNIQAVFQWEGKHPIDPKGFTIMSYNVRLFNAYHWIKRKGVDVDISNYIKDQHPDILLLQEYKTDKKTDFSQYKFKNIVQKGKKRKAGLAIYSKFKIIDKGNFNYKDTYNNAIWADVLIGNDTVRIYNVHLQSYKIIKPENLVEEDKAEVSKKMQKVFEIQAKQAKIVQSQIEKISYPVIVGGDFNNTAFSAPYHILKDGKNDAFVEADSGFGTTWQYKKLPLRIDFILPDKKFEVVQFETLNYIEYSDHFPIKAMLRLKERH